MPTFHQIHVISNSRTPVLTSIKNGSKPVEGRKNSPFYQKIKKDDIILFEAKRESDNDLKELYCCVTYIHKYRTLEDYLEKEGYKKTLPWTNSMEEALQSYNSWTRPEDRNFLLQKYGYSFLGIGVAPINRIDSNLRHEYYDLIKNGKKTIEGRTYTGKWKHANKLDIIVFNNTLMVQIVDIKQYNSIPAMIKGSGLKNILPNKKTLSEGIDLYESIPGYKDAKKFVALSLIKVEK